MSLGRFFAVGDVHGCHRAWSLLMRTVRLQDDDKLLLLGDYVDRGPGTPALLDELVERQARGQVIALRGNHDELMLKARHSSADEQRWLAAGGDAVLDSYGGKLSKVPDAHWTFLESTKLVHETEHTIFVHGHVEPMVPLEVQDSPTLLWRKLTPEAIGHMSGKRIVCGHTAQKTGLPLDMKHTVCIDTWAYGGGYLTALNMSSGKYVQASQAGKTRKGKIKSIAKTSVEHV